MTARCKPPEELRGVDGWHWIQWRSDRPRPALWRADLQEWMDTLTASAGAHYRYVAPIPSHYALADLVSAARDLDKFAWSMVRLPNAESPPYLQSLINDLRAALAPFTHTPE